MNSTNPFSSALKLNDTQKYHNSHKRIRLIINNINELKKSLLHYLNPLKSDLQDVL